MSEDVWITGYGVVSALGAQQDRWTQLGASTRAPHVDVCGYPTYPVRDFEPARYVERRSDVRQMGPLMLYGVGAASDALRMASLSSESEAMRRLQICVAADGGERDPESDEATFRAGLLEASARLTNDSLMRARPSLFLTQLPNLIASNICITRGFAAPSRTLLGTETIAVDALRLAVARIRSGQESIFLVGAAKNAQCMNYVMSVAGRGLLAPRPHQSVWSPAADGLCLASGAAFVVVESETHARSRGVAGLARIASVHTSFAPREQRELCQERLMSGISAAPPPKNRELGVISGITGSLDIAGRERAFLSAIEADGTAISARAPALSSGHPMEVSFFSNLSLGIACLEKRALFPALDPAESFEARLLSKPLTSLLVTSWGSTDGEGFARIEALS